MKYCEHCGAREDQDHYADCVENLEAMIIKNMDKIKFERKWQLAQLLLTGKFYANADEVRSSATSGTGPR